MHCLKLVILKMEPVGEADRSYVARIWFEGCLGQQRDDGGGCATIRKGCEGVEAMDGTYVGD